jgi:hypothetical protein
MEVGRLAETDPDRGLRSGSAKRQLTHSVSLTSTPAFKPLVDYCLTSPYGLAQ